MPTIRLTDSQATAVLQSLEEAHAIYLKCARDTEDTTPRIADQFKRQAAECVVIRTIIEEA